MSLATIPDIASQLIDARVRLGRPLVMGIVNATPDSFFEGSRGETTATAIALGERLASEGADILDIGGESTRPGSESISDAEELARVIPVIEALVAKTNIPISIDTSKPEVASAAYNAGATVLNDIAALRGGADMPRVAARFPLVILMHMLGESPRTMQKDPHYENVVSDITVFLKERVAVLGADSKKVWIDPGIGFGKTVEHNLEILRGLEVFAKTAPVVVGASRKSFLGKILGTEEQPLPTEQRLAGSLAVACRAAQADAMCVRVHDVKETVSALEIWRRSL